MSTNKRRRQNGSKLPFSNSEEPPIKLEELPKLSDEELLAIANGQHANFIGSLRKAIIHNARIAGMALSLLKERIEHGAWGTWLDENFEGSPETARAYIRVARNWETIEANGFDRLDGAPLGHVLWVLSQAKASSKDPPSNDSDNGDDDEKDDDTGEGDPEPTGDPPKPPEPPSMIQIFLEKCDKDEFEEMVSYLMQVYGIDDHSMTVLKAVRHCYKQEKCRDKNHSVDELSA
jgi:hypothetical protein